MNLTTINRQIFAQAHIVAGKPLLRLYPAVEQWALPAGFAYNPYNDAFADAEGEPVAAAPDAWATPTDLPCVPGATRLHAPLGPQRGARASDGEADVYVLYDAALDIALQDAWGFQMHGVLYELVDLERMPEAMPMVFVLRLSKKTRGTA